MTYRAYLRTFGGQISEKTITTDAGAAFAAFAALVNRADLDGQKMAAALTHDNQQMAFHRFDRSPGDADYWRDKLHELPIASRHDDAAAAAYVSRYQWPDGGMQAMPVEQLRDLLAEAYRAGYEAGRQA